MGERLVVRVKRNDKLLATSYYHWSAYTQPALHILKSMRDHVLNKHEMLDDNQIKLAMIRFAERSTHLGYFETNEERDEAIERCRKDNEDKPEPVKQLLEGLVYTHGGLDPCDRNLAESLFPNESFEIDNVSRNEGLVAISDASMESQSDWAQCIVTINLDDKKISNGAVYEYDIAGYLEETEEYDDEFFIDPYNLPRSPIDLGEFSIDDIDIVQDVIETTGSDWIRYEDKIYQLIQG